MITGENRIVYTWQCECDPDPELNGLQQINWHPFYVMQCPDCGMDWPIDIINEDRQLYAQFSHPTAYPSTMNDEYASRDY